MPPPRRASLAANEGSAARADAPNARAGLARAAGRHGASARLPGTGKEASPAPLVAFTARAFSPARRSHRARQTPVRVRGGMGTLLMFCAASASRRPGGPAACGGGARRLDVKRGPARRRRRVAVRALPRLRKWCWHGTSALCHGQASLPTKAASPVDLRFESSLARRLPSLNAARADAPNVQSGPSASRQEGTPRPPGFRARAKRTWRRRSCSSPPALAPRRLGASVVAARAAAASRSGAGRN
jgi:hypothetical protein